MMLIIFTLRNYPKVSDEIKRFVYRGYLERIKLYFPDLANLTFQGALEDSRLRTPLGENTLLPLDT